MDAGRAGPYELLEELGRGGMGVVHRARDRRTGRVVVVKLLLARPDPGLLARFQREGRAAAAVRHPELVELIETGVDALGRPYLVLEHVTGGSLAGRLRGGGPLPWPEAVRCAAGVARALGALHARGLVHRDVKPANVLLTADGAVKLGDLGLVRASAASGLTRGGLTRTGDVLGTPEFIAPEQADGQREVDGRADLYALGCTLFALLSGRPPFAGQGLSLLRAHLEAPPPRLRDHLPEAPPALEELLLRLLEKDPARRPRSADEVAEALERLGAPAAPVARRRRGAAVAAGLLGLGLLGAGGWWALGAGADPAPGEGGRGEAGPAPGDLAAPGAAAADPPSGWRTEVTTLVDEPWTTVGWIYELVPGPDGTLLVAANEACVLQLDAATGRARRAFDLQARVSIQRLDVRGRHALALGLERGGLYGGEPGAWLLDLESGACRPLGPRRRWRATALLDERTALLWGEEGLVRWDIGPDRPVGEPIPTRPPAPGLATAHRALDVSAGGRWAAVAVAGGFDLIELAAERVLETSAPGIWEAVAFAPEGERLLLGGAEVQGGPGVLELWEVPGAPRRARSFLVHPRRGPVRHVTWSPDGRRALSCERVRAGATALVWDVDREDPLLRLDHLSAPIAGSFLVEGAIATAEAEYGRVRRWDPDSGEELGQPTAHGGGVRGAAFARLQSDQLATVGQDGALAVWSIERRRLHSRRSPAPANEPGPGESPPPGLETLRVVRALDATRWVTGGEDGRVLVWAPSGQREIARHGANGAAPAVMDILVTPRGIVSGGQDGEVLRASAQARREATAERLASLGDPEAKKPDWVMAIATTADERLLLASARGLGVARPGTELVFALPGWSVEALATSLDRRFAYVGGFDGRVRRLGLEGEDVVEDASFRLGHRSPICALAVGPELGASASGADGLDRTVRLWELERGAEVARVDLTPDGDRATCLAWSPDGRRLAIGTGRGRVLVVDVSRPGR